MFIYVHFSSKADATLFCCVLCCEGCGYYSLSFHGPSRTGKYTKKKIEKCDNLMAYGKVFGERAPTGLE